jgi:predicted transcriptional regulator of viral defense system
MKFETLLDLVGEDPTFETSLLLAGAVDQADIRRQLSRWTHAGRLVQLRRGLYMLAPPFQKTVPHPFLLANRLVPASYVSCQSALAYDGLIPEHTPVTVSVTTGRPGRRTIHAGQVPVDDFIFRHLQQDLFFGYRRREVMRGQFAYVALPEKAILDLAYLEPHGDDPAFLAELRLQHLDQLDMTALDRLVQRAGKPKLKRVADEIKALTQAERSEYESL